MSYKIAIATSDGKNVDQHFGSAKIFEVFQAEGTEFSLAEKRRTNADNTDSKTQGCCSEGGCGNGDGQKCGAPNEKSDVVELLDDCRCIVCTKMGGSIQKQFERKAITVFEVELPISEVLTKITTYYNNIDRRKLQAQRSFS